MLHITNGDAAGALISRARVGGYVLPWNDVLHEGAVRAGLSLDELSDERARFIASCGWDESMKVRTEFRSRDERLKRAAEDDEVVLWFEHDLYDQLQLLQLLDHFGSRREGAAEVRLICIGAHEEVADFHGLGQLNPEQIGDLFPKRAAVSAEQLELASRAWAAFRADDPRGIEHLLAEETAALPFLRDAMRRLLQQFPASENGLARTEANLLRTLEAAGACGLPKLFDESQAYEEARFLGDWTFVGLYLEPLCVCAVPLVRVDDAKAGGEHGGGDALNEGKQFHRKFRRYFDSTFEITAAGRDVLRAGADHVAMNGIDRWHGGVHLRDGNVWRWDDAAGKIIAPQ